MLQRQRLVAASCMALIAGCAPASGSSTSVVPAISVPGVSEYRLLYRFQGGSDGANPQASLTPLGSTLYGTTQNGGSSACKGGCGTVFAVSAQGKESVLYRFPAGTGGAFPLSTLFGANGALTGTTMTTGKTCGFATTSSSSEVVERLDNCGTVFAVKTSGAERIVYELPAAQEPVSEPSAGLIDIRGVAYGVTAFGGTGSCGSTGSSSGVPVQTQLGCGTVFVLRGAQNFKVLYSFNTSSSAADGAVPAAPLLAYKGTLYGTTVIGGSNACAASSFASSSSGGSCGTVFGITPFGLEHVVYRFAGGRDGVWPYAGLIAVNGKLYGTTEYGGASASCPGGCGTVFDVTPGGIEHIVYRFRGGSDGAHPMRALLEVNGSLYGTTLNGGSVHCKNGCGTVFAIGPLGKETVVYRFQGGSDGAAPQSSVVAMKGVLYGMTSAGGGASACSGGCGTIFSLKP
jgi:uncharacterized repeat protein (TIGR03803 family)